MTEPELDDWFFNLPACQQMDITAICFDEMAATDQTYEEFDREIAGWWDERSYEEKLTIYKNEEK